MTSSFAELINLTVRQDLLDLKKAPLVEKKPWAGNLLPALIYVFDFEIDLERASYGELLIEAEKAERATLAKVSKAQTIISNLEKKYADKIEVLKELHKQMADLKAKVDSNDRRHHQAVTPEQLIQEHVEKAHAQSDQQYKELVASKQSTSKAKKLFKKLSSLCHPDKTGGDEALTEIFLAGKLAVDLGDSSTLEQLLITARQYLSGDRKKNILDRIKRNKKLAKEKVRAAHEQARAFSSSFLQAVLTASDKGGDALDVLFNESVEHSRRAMINRMQVYSNFIASQNTARVFTTSYSSTSMYTINPGSFG